MLCHSCLIPLLSSLMSLNFRLNPKPNQAIKQTTDIIRKRCSSAQAVSARMLSNRSIPSENADPFPPLPPLTTSSGQTVLPIRMVCLLSVPCFLALFLQCSRSKRQRYERQGQSQEMQAEAADAGRQIDAICFPHLEMHIQTCSDFVF